MLCASTTQCNLHPSCKQQNIFCCIVYSTSHPPSPPPPPPPPPKIIIIIIIIGTFKTIYNTMSETFLIARRYYHLDDFIYNNYNDYFIYIYIQCTCTPNEILASYNHARAPLGKYVIYHYIKPYMYMGTSQSLTPRRTFC